MDSENEERIPLFLFTFNRNKKNDVEGAFVTKLLEVLPKKISLLYVFGFEELCSIMEGCFPEIAHKKLVDINEELLMALRKKYSDYGVKFRTLALVQRGAMGLTAITPYYSKFDDIRLSSSACGYGYSSMKGAVGIRLRYKTGTRDGKKKEVELTLVNAHLSAYEGEYYYRRRNEQLIQLMRSMDFGDGYSVLKPRAHCFIMGDLNYRTSKAYDRSSTITKDIIDLQGEPSSKDDVERVVERYDELTLGRKAGEVLIGFSEGCVSFPPTYKYHTNTAIYNQKRSPSWCDRIFYLSTYREHNSWRLRESETDKTATPEVKEYNSIPSLLFSDHRPVYLSIDLPITPPESIISPSGCLQITSLEEDAIHNHLSENDEISPNIANGPTLIYMKTIQLDRFIQNLISPTSDWMIGYFLWCIVTYKGRFCVSIVVLLCWFLFRIFISHP
ncbi:Piso0_005496 [Millerozyma farinosa CBS 7064]|uniref:Piso0_005496 protein n=1 Tax=Pichia sorbitophila (strain ATCC MYA-4447 / BCRC 22081 / CBS 7064 / NBRC 10061 / NRRL Y-12695) TaxID=559304 RepID=G8Y249_PICSO|nr:Piso0_005496 [Millerozyma farinosa CBS 7064]